MNRYNRTARVCGEWFLRIACQRNLIAMIRSEKAIARIVIVQSVAKTTQIAEAASLAAKAVGALFPITVSKSIPVLFFVKWPPWKRWLWTGVRDAANHRNSRDFQGF